MEGSRTLLSSIHDPLVLPSLSEISKSQKTEPENTPKSFQTVLQSELSQALNTRSCQTRQEIRKEDSGAGGGYAV